MFAELDITRENNYFYDGAAIEKVKYFPTYFLTNILRNLMNIPNCCTYFAILPYNWKIFLMAP